MLIEARRGYEWPAWEDPTVVGDGFIKDDLEGAIIKPKEPAPINPTLQEQFKVLNGFRETWTRDLIHSGLGVLAWVNLRAELEDQTLIDGSGRVRLQPIQASNHLGDDVAALAFWCDARPAEPVFEPISARSFVGRIQPARDEYRLAAESVFDMLEGARAVIDKGCWPDVDPRTFQIPFSRYELSDAERQEVLELEFGCNNYLYLPTTSL